MNQRLKTYLLSGGLQQLLRNRHRIPVSARLARELEQVEMDFYRKFASHFQGYEDQDEQGPFLWDIKFMGGDEIERALKAIVDQKKDGTPVISFDDVYCPELADGTYSVTRLMDSENLDGGTFLGPRFRHFPLEDQLSFISECFSPVIDIMDVGTFDGETLGGEIRGRFKRAGINVRNAYMVFAGTEGIKSLSESGVNLFYHLNPDWVDWLELRDCVGLDGRKVGLNGHPPSIVNCFIPYTENPINWASIPPTHCDKFRELYFDTFRNIAEVLQDEGYHLSHVPHNKSNNVLGLQIVERK
jgi:hypothetical protein